MMINKENDKKKPNDSATIEVLAKLVIRDKKSGKVLVNKRG